MTAGTFEPLHTLHSDSSELPCEAYAAALAGLPGMGPARLTAVLAAMSPFEAWSQLRTPGSDSQALKDVLNGHYESLVAAWRKAAGRVEAEEAWEDIVSLGLGVALHGSPGYPSALVGDIEPPPVLFHSGRPEAIAGPRVAIVGTRRCSSLGSGVAFELGRDLAASGVAVVSGLATGIDSAAHRGALQAGGAPPIGVVATGLDVVYPLRQCELWRQVAEVGVLLGEAPPGTQPERWRFPARNRIIAALADVVVVVESHARGGAMYTVDEAARRSVDVMAVPGSVRSSASKGTNGLLAEGRGPVRDASDVLMALGLNAAGHGTRADRRIPPSDGDRVVLEAVGWQPSTLDHLVLRTSRDVTQVVEALYRLSEAGWVAQRGSWYERVVDGCE